MQQTSEIYTCAVQTPTLRGRLFRTHKARGRPLSICSLIVSLFILPRLAPPRGQSDVFRGVLGHARGHAVVAPRRRLVAHASTPELSAQ